MYPQSFISSILFRSLAKNIPRDTVLSSYILNVRFLMVRRKHFYLREWSAIRSFLFVADGIAFLNLYTGSIVWRHKITNESGKQNYKKKCIPHVDNKVQHIQKY